MALLDASGLMDFLDEEISYAQKVIGPRFERNNPAQIFFGGTRYYLTTADGIYIGRGHHSDMAREAKIEQPYQVPDRGVFHAGYYKVNPKAETIEERWRSALLMIQHTGAGTVISEGDPKPTIGLLRPMLQGIAGIALYRTSVYNRDYSPDFRRLIPVDL